MIKKEFWSKDIKLGQANILNKDLDVDVLIIGGGLTGINSAYYLKDSNFKICVVDQGYIGMGVSSRTTGKINYLQETIYSHLENKYSFEVARKYYYSQKFAINELKRIIEKENIDCDFDKVISYVYTDDDNEISSIKKEYTILKKFGCDVKEHLYKFDNIKCKYAISVDDTYVFHPLKYLYKLKEIILKNGIDVYENCRVQDIKRVTNGYQCFTDSCKINTKKVILACHYPFFLKPYMMPIKVYNEKSYIVVSEVNDYKNLSYITSSFPVTSVRYHKEKKNYMFYLSNSHNICNELNENKNFNNIIKSAEKNGLKVKYVWSNDDMMSIDRMPYIGRLEKNNNDLLIGTAFSTWGMTNSLLAGFILSNMVKGIKTSYESLFSPLRTNSLKNIGSIFINVGSSLKSMFENKICQNKNWYKNVRFETRDGVKVAIYYDGKKEHIVLSNCPHMGCTLLFNEVEKTWDCPCHASRFDIDGKCLKGPSNYDIMYKEK